ncbi:TPA: hypothetical protein DCX15_05480 [bacterium]|nr:hypothetical protein [bacterium]
MVTIFSIPKSFLGLIGTIQRNAIQSWHELCPKCEIILFGDEDGTAQVAAEFGVIHIPEVRCNEFGTPLLDFIFKKVQDLAIYQVLTFVNTDIILMDEFLKAIQSIKQDSFLVVGQRWNFELKDRLKGPDWKVDLKSAVRKEGILCHPGAIDYFVFSKGLFKKVPPFAVGRAGYDNWLIYDAWARRIPVIDATHVVMAIHQNHDYSHLPNGRDGVFKGIEAERNKKLTEGHVFTIRDGATHILTPKGLIPTTRKPEILLQLASQQQDWFKALGSEKKRKVISTAYNLGILYEEKGLLEMALKKFETAINLSQKLELNTAEETELVSSLRNHLEKVYQMDRKNFLR